MLPIALLSKKNLTSRLAIRRISGITAGSPEFLYRLGFLKVTSSWLFGLYPGWLMKTLRAGLPSLLRATEATYPSILNAN